MSSVSGNEDDRLSRLPEEILSHILSLMPTKLAVRTSILSKRWRFSWMFVTNLDCGDIHTMDSLHSLTKIVDRVLKSCTPSQVKSFRLHFPLICARKSSVPNWIDELVRLKISELDLQVHQLQLPSSMFTCKTLTKLRLEPSDYVFDIRTLKRLKLTWAKFAPPPNHKVILNVPNLEYLFVGKVLCSSFVMKDVSSLVEASVLLRYLPSNDEWVDLLKGLSGVKSLSVRNLKSLIEFNSLTSSPLIFPNMKHLVLHDIRHPGQVLHFLKSSPELEHLCIEGYRKKPKEDSWVEPELVPACMTTNLTTIMFSICEWWKCDIPFLKYMMGNAKVLETITLTCENISTEEEKLCAEVVKLLPMASRYCEIHFHGN